MKAQDQQQRGKNKPETWAGFSLSPSEGERVHGRKTFAICAPEPTPNPSHEGNCRRASAGLLPAWEGLGVGRFMGRVGASGKVPDRIPETEPPLLDETPHPGPLRFRRGEGIGSRNITPRATFSV